MVSSPDEYRVRLAHFSDIHLTVPPVGSSGIPSGSEQGRAEPRGAGMTGKRLAGLMNYYVGGRGKHFEGAGERIERLLEDVDAAAPDHALCTGDVTQMSWPLEFETVGGLFGARLEQPERYTVLPGNHDRYTPDAVETDLFGRYFGRLAAPEGRYPAVKDLGAGVSLVLVDVTRACSLIDSSGLVGERQLDELESVLTDASMADRFVVLAMHYGLFREDGRPDRARHGIRDYEALLALIDRPEVHLDLVLHGHMHRPYVARTQRRRIVCVGSATDLHVRGGWHLLDLDPATKGVSIERRVWSSEVGAFVASTSAIPGSELLSSQ